MYTITQILAAAGVSAKPFTPRGVTVLITAADQLIGTRADLKR
jgi:hypothetical protein